ncbi:MAG: PAS domain S-box protein [Nitrospiraceae bacterium]|nr:PAS domain S-box protein [Nitrospiraceae bacterium]
MRLRTKITVSVSVLVTLLLTVLSFVTFSYYERKLKQTIAADHDAMLTALADQIDSKLLMAHGQLIANAETVPGEALRDADAAQRFLDGRSGLKAIFDNHIGLFTPGGIEIAESPNTIDRRGKDFSFRPYIRQTIATEKPVITDPYKSSQIHGHAAIMMTAPVFNKRGDLAGILAGSLDLTKDNILGSIGKTRIGKTGYLFLTTADRTVIIHPLKERIFKQITPGMNRLYDRVVNEGFEGTDETINFLGMDLLTTYKRLKVNRWILGANYPKAEAYAPVYAAIRFFTGVMAAGIFCIIAATWFLVRRFTEPLAAFTRHVKTIPGKQGGSRLIAVRSGDEIGILVSAFNEMLLQFDGQQKALRESEEKFRELADSLPQTVFETDNAARFTYVNRTALSMIGYTRDDVERGLNIADIIAEEDRELAVRNFTALAPGEWREHQEYRARRKDGTIFPCMVHSSPVMRSGAAAGLRGILIDISDRKKTEAELLRAQKLESLGILAGGIAHDFNNILTGIMGNLSLAKMRLDPEDDLHQWLDEAEKASFHARDLTYQLLTFSRGSAPVKKVIALEPLIRDAATFAVRGTAAKIEMQLESSLSPVEADQGQVVQIINNLIINACQSMPEGGTIRVRVCNERIDAETSTGLPAGDYVSMAVEDSGIGIPAEHLPRIFDPYFTTKQTGSGLGLAVVYSIVRNHGGDISVESVLGRGTIFTVRLPAQPEAAAPDSGTATKLSCGSGRILVMDDEEIVRATLGAILPELGYSVSFAREGREAVSLYREALDSGQGFDAVIMDLTIPGGMGGKETVLELLAIDPRAKAIVSSGYSNDPVMAEFRAHGFSGVIKKPFQVQELSEVLHRVLCGGS